MKKMREAWGTEGAKIVVGQRWASPQKPKNATTENALDKCD